MLPALNLSLSSLSLQPIPMTQEQINNLYKMLNPEFQTNEDNFNSYMKTISEINEKIEDNMRNSHDILSFLYSEQIEELEDVNKSFIFPFIKGKRLIPKSITVNSRIVKTKEGLLPIIYKMFMPSIENFEYMKCIFNNEIYYQLEAYKLMTNHPELSLIVPFIDMNQLFVFKNEETGVCVFVLGMEYITDMVDISSILTEANYLEIYTKIKNIILALNKNRIYHNDLNRNNIRAKIVTDKTTGISEIKIVLIDFGEARNDKTAAKSSCSWFGLF